MIGPKEVAEGLSEAQRRFVLSKSPEWACVWNAQAAQAVLSKGLGERITSHCFRLTPLGLAVRDILTKDQSHVG
jgi:hypothetical protein